MKQDNRGHSSSPSSTSLERGNRALIASGKSSAPGRHFKRRGTGAENAGTLLRVLVAVIWIAVIVAAVALGWKLSRGGIGANASQQISNAATPAANVVSSANAGVADTERQEVLKRIDVMANVTAENKERLYVYVERAKKITRVLNVNFERSKNKLSETAIKKIVEESRKPEFASQARDPAVVFVVLGFADKQGSEKTNVQTSLERAETVMEVLRKQCGMLNVIQTVPMGVSDLFNPDDPKGNRVVEVWAVLP